MQEPAQPVPGGHLAWSTATLPGKQDSARERFFHLGVKLTCIFVRDACVQAALLAYEDAGIQGLCAEGRWEYAIGAIHGIDLEAIFSTFRSSVKLSLQPPSQE